MKMLPIIQSLWIGSRLSTMEKLCIVSFMKQGHIFHLYTYGEAAEVPQGTIVKDANEIIPSDKIFKYKDYDSYAGFANMFRYKLLFEKGGYWVDMDNICLQSFDGDQEYVFSSQRPKNPVSEYILQEPNNGVIRVPKGSEIMAFCYEEAAQKDKDKIIWGETGPKLLEKAVEKYRLNAYVAKPEVYCAVNWWEWDRFIDGMVDKTILSNARSVHLWNEMWRRHGVDKECQFHKDSLYEYFKSRYLGTVYDETRPAFTLNKHLKKYNNKEIDMIRDSAIALEKTNIKLAYALMLIAHKGRPDGKFIKKKLEEYNQLLTSSV